MVSVKKLDILLRKTDLTFECDGVLNTATIEHSDLDAHLLNLTTIKKKYLLNLTNK
ncbi:MAG: hypothetical protein IPH93_02655 [Saprospiraceae bacterium]|nr:hypothetical protein [Saprospiraceae bacterium]